MPEVSPQEAWKRSLKRYYAEAVEILGSEGRMGLRIPTGVELRLLTKFSEMAANAYHLGLNDGQVLFNPLFMEE